MNFLEFVLLGCGAGIFIFFVFMGIVSLREKESRAAARAFVLALLLPLPFILLCGGFSAHRPLIGGLLLGMIALLLLILFFPTGKMSHLNYAAPRGRIDERDIMFSRRLLEPGSEKFVAYYRENPDRKAADDAFRAQPGLLEPGSSCYDPYQFAAADASFATVEKLKPFVEGAVAPERQNPDPEKITAFLKKWAKKLGALDVGVTELKDYHLYSVVGRGKDYGKPVTLSHRYAIAFTVEMDKFMLDGAPRGSTVMESAQQYLACGAIAVQVADFIRRLGYPARAHIDGNYRVVCPLVARDAGLGEIGRMGLLMTPKLGPRVRIAVVTTDLPLIPDEPFRDGTVIDFCRICKKCTDACPAQAISFEYRREINGVKRWQINQEACYTFWCVCGTDCGRCVSVCPYSHPDNLLHNFVRFGIRNSSVFRRVALRLDDFFYGRIPVSKELPEWIKIEGVK